MLQNISNRRVTATHVVTTRVIANRSKAPVFSIDTHVPQVGDKGAKPASEVFPAPVAPSPQRQDHTAAADFRQLFSGLPGPAIPAADTAPPEAPFVPVFRNATITDGKQVWALNRTYFASQETAQWIASKYGNGLVVEVPAGGNGGFFSASANEYHVKLADGRLVNAGILAGYYERNPPDKFPGLADKLIRAQLGLA